MANLTRNFTAGVMNKMVDERLIPNGQYIDALNVRMGSTENAEVGVNVNDIWLRFQQIAHDLRHHLHAQKQYDL